MQIQVHEVDAEVARTHLADQRVHVGAVHVEQAALGVHDFGDLVNLLLENAERIGIGQHQRSDFFIHLRRERGHIHHAARVRFQILHRITHHGGGRRIGAMRGVRNQNFLARRALGLVISAHQQESGQFAMRARGRLQRDRIHAGDFEQAVAQSLHDAQRALRNSSPADKDARWPGLRAATTTSFTRGLYFMVQEPSGYMPRSMA